MSITTDRAAIHRAILEQPADDLHRHAYADWLEENGSAADVAYAAFIRAQLDAAQPVSIALLDGNVMLRGDLRPGREAVERAALGMSVDHFRVTIPRRLLPCKVSIWHPRLQDEAPAELDQMMFSYLSLSRGLVCHVETTCDQFMACAESLFRDHPITGVKLLRKGARQVPGGRWRWDRHGDPASPHTVPLPASAVLHAWVLPAELYDQPSARGAAYDTAEESREALSAACVSYGRGLVGLPPLN
jgi:uncharacterized protein (TIGR02996 family)